MNLEGKCWRCQGYGNSMGSIADRGRDFNPVCVECRGTGRRRWSLLSTPLTDEERAAEKWEPHPGMGLRYRRGEYFREPDSDSGYLKLSQDATDQLIFRELDLHIVDVERKEWRSMSPPTLVMPGEPAIPLVSDWLEPGRAGATYANYLVSRGGIHSEPIIRAYAYRAWGLRDQVWDLQSVENLFKIRGRDRLFDSDAAGMALRR